MAEQNETVITWDTYSKQFLGILSIPFVTPVAEGFFENIKRITSLVQMPNILFSFIEVDKYVFSTFKLSVEESWNAGSDYQTFMKRYEERPDFKVSEHLPDLEERIKKRFDTTFANPSYGPFLQTSMQVLYSAAVSASWTALECLAADLWITSVNEKPLPLAQAAIATLDPQETGELTSKQISVGLAARHGFDLRHCLGTVLKTKFDFTGVSGIRKAYKVFVPNNDLIERVFADPRLGTLEATRNLIVHKAGKVDEEYKKRVESDLQIGSVLTFTENEAVNFMTAAKFAGIGLLAFVNDWFAAKSRTVTNPGSGDSISE
jgi:hypothetical protein